MWTSGFSGIEWWTGLEWWMVLMGFHLLVMTTSEQRPPLNKDHLNLIAKYLSSMVCVLLVYIADSEHN